VGLGVDGSASNDSSNMIGEVRQTMLLNRLASGLEGQEQGLVSAREALELATVGGASVLGRDDLGRLAPGYAADLIAIDLDRIEFSGALHDPVAAVVFCPPGRVDHSWVAGARLVDDGNVVGVDQGRLIEEHNHLSLGLTH
jgi:8-oxoguanine deaminase